MSASLTIVHVETGRQLYGGAAQVLYLLRGLKDRGHRNVLVCAEGAAIATAAADCAERVHALPVGGDLDLGFISRLRGVFAEERPQLVHLHSRRGADVLGGIAARLAHLPVVLSRRVDNPEGRAWAALKYRLYDRVIAISEGIRAVLAREGVPAGKLRCVRSALDARLYREARDRDWFQSEFGIEPGAPAIGMVAQLIERKGHRHLLDAVPSVARAFPDARFLLFGKGPLATSIESRTRELGLTDRVRLVGFRDDLPRVLPCLDLLVHPAEMEGLGVSLLQAAAAGLPVVASRVGGIPEIVRDGINGYLVPARDAAALTRAILTVLQDSSKARLFGEAGRRLVEAEFSIDGMIEGNLRVYRELLATGAVSNAAGPTP